MKPNQSASITVQIRWVAPPNGYFKLNIDGSFIENNARCSIDGVFRNSQGSWIFGFCVTANSHCHTMTEFESLKHGLEFVITHKLSLLVVETDSVEILYLIQQPTMLFTNIATKCRLMLRSIGNPVVQHNFQEANRVADCLSKIGANLNQPENIISLRSPPFVAAIHLAYDVKGVVSTHLVSWSMFNNILCVGNPSVSSYVNSNAKPTSINVFGCNSATVMASDKSTLLLCNAT
ncbi:hypothetical protein P3L10_026776 [Capsicum annuum]